MIRVPGYRLVEPLGVGGTATVYRAVATDGRPAAVKVAHPALGARARLTREAAALRAIGPRHAPAVYGLGDSDAGPFLAMELCAEPSLARRLADDGPLALPTALALFAQLAEAVAAAHAVGVIHRDLTPSNVLCGARVRLIDLGLAGSIDGTAGQTHVGEVVGTAAYMAPEQWRPGALHDARTDVYALGCLLYLLVTGAPPFTGDRGALQSAHLGLRPELLSRRVAEAAWLDELAIGCLAKAPGDRVPSVAAMLAGLEAAAVDGRRPAALERPAASAVVPRVFATLWTEREPTVLDGLAQAHGARVVHGDGARCALVVDEPGLDRALTAARGLGHALVAERAAPTVLVDVHDATVRARRSGPSRIVAAALASPDAYPVDDDPPGVLLGPRAAAALGGGLRPLAERARWLVDEQAPAPAPTIDALFGRAAELAAVEASVDEVVAGRGPVVATVVAEAGHGLSRFARALAERLRAHPALDVVELAAGEPDALARLARAAFAGDDDPAERERLRARLAPVAWAALAVTLGWQAPAALSLGPAPIAPGALRGEAARAIALGLRQRARARPLAIVVDDLDRADLAVLDALELAALAEAGAPLWVCGLGRPELAASRPGWGQRARAQPRWRLGPLDDDAADELLRAALAPVTEVPREALARLRGRAAGVPLLLLELVASLRRAGALRRHGKGQAWYLASDELDRLPASPTVVELATRELAALSPALAAHAELAAVLGEVVDVALVRAVIDHLVRGDHGDEVPLDARVGLTRLAAVGFLAEQGGERFAFRHRLVRDAIVRAIPGERRARWHRAAAEHLASLDVAEVGPRLAEHLAGAGRDADAAALCARLAEAAHARHAYVDAERWFGAALAHGGPPTALARWRRARGVVRTRLGRYDDARADLTAALAATPAEQAAEVWLDLATTLDWCDEWRASAEAAERAAALAGPQPPPALAAGLALARGRSHHRFSRDAQAVPWLREAVALAGALGPDGYEVTVVGLVLLGYILPGQGQLDEAAAVLAQVIALCEQAGDRWHLAAAHNNRVNLWTALGARERVVADLEQVRRIGRELGYDRMEWFALYNLAESEFWLGEVEPALAHVADAIAVDERSLGEHGRPRSHLLRARILAWSGDPRAAAVLAALDRHQAEAEAAGHAEALLVPGERVQLALVRRQVEGGDAAAWAALLAEARQHLAGQELIEAYEAAARAAARAGEHAAERDAIVAALALAHEVPSLGRQRLRTRLAELG